MMLTDRYLYGTEEEVMEIPEEVIVRRVELLRANIDELLKVHYFERDNERINKVLKAIEFWTNINNK